MTQLNLPALLTAPDSEAGFSLGRACSGKRYRKPQLTERGLTAGQWLLFVTDGVSYSGGALPGGTVATVVRQLVESSGKLHDDAAALAARWVESAP